MKNIGLPSLKIKGMLKYNLDNKYLLILKKIKWFPINLP